MATYLVTGGCGFIGSHIVRALAARGDRIRILDDLSSGRLENLTGLEVGGPGTGAPVELFRASILDPGACSAGCGGVAAVFHQAAQVSVPRSIEDPLASYEVNVIGTLQLLEAAHRARIGRFVFAASSAVYGNAPTLPKTETLPLDPLSPYASGKLAGEQLMRVYGVLHGMRTVSLRYFNVFGPGQADDNPYTGVIALFARALLEGRRPRIFGDGSQTRDFTYVDNVVDANLLAIERNLEPGIAINVGAGERISINSIYAETARLIGSDLTAEHLPARPGDVRDSLAALDRARALLGYTPRIGWKHGLATTIDWYRRRSSGAGA